MHAPSRAFGLVLLAGLAALPLAAQSGPASPTSAPTPSLAASTLLAGGGPIWPGAGAVYADDAPLAFQSVERNRGKGALWGAGLGLVAGGVLAAEDGAPPWGVVIGALMVAGLGAVLGATVFAPSRSGGTAGGGNLAVHVAPRSLADGPGVGVGLRWRR